MAGVTSDLAAEAIKDACATKYCTSEIPEAENEAAEISQTDLNTSEEISYSHNVITDESYATELACVSNSKEVSKQEYLRLQPLLVVQKNRYIYIERKLQQLRSLQT